MSNVDWSAIDHLATRLLSQSEGAEALRALAREMQEIEVLRRERGIQLEHMTVQLDKAHERLEQARTEEQVLQKTVRQLRQERDAAERAAEHRLNVLESGLAATERAEKAALDASLEEYRQAHLREVGRLHEELEDLEKRVEQAKATLDALKRV